MEGSDPARKPPWSPQEVEQYLERFRVEEVVQAAINSAIRTRALDPVAHVADFLEARGREQQQHAASGQSSAHEADAESLSGSSSESGSRESRMGSSSGTYEGDSDCASTEREGGGERTKQPDGQRRP